MMYLQKNQIAKVMPVVFDDEVLSEFVEKSKYRKRCEFAKNIQNRDELRRHFNKMSSLTGNQHIVFRTLCLMQLDVCTSRVTNPKILEYFRLVRVANDPDTKFGIGALQNMINRKEVKLMKSLSLKDDNIRDITEFLKIAMLFGSQSLIYDMETKAALDLLCTAIAA